MLIRLKSTLQSRGSPSTCFGRLATRPPCALQVGWSPEFNLQFPGVLQQNGPSNVEGQMTVFYRATFGKRDLLHEL